jgi:hypothetical protein
MVRPFVGMFNQVVFLDHEWESKPIDTNARYLGVGHDHFYPNRTDYIRRTLLTDLVLTCALHHWSTGALEHWSTSLFHPSLAGTVLLAGKPALLILSHIHPTSTRGEELEKITTSWVTD